MRAIRALLFIAVMASAYPALGRDADIVRVSVDANDAGTKIAVTSSGSLPSIWVAAFTKESGLARARRFRIRGESAPTS